MPQQRLLGQLPPCGKFWTTDSPGTYCDCIQREIEPSAHFAASRAKGFRRRMAVAFSDAADYSLKIGLPWPIAFFLTAPQPSSTSSSLHYDETRFTGACFAGASASNTTPISSSRETMPLHDLNPGSERRGIFHPSTAILPRLKIISILNGVAPGATVIAWRTRTGNQSGFSKPHGLPKLPERRASRTANFVPPCGK